MPEDEREEPLTEVRPVAATVREARFTAGEVLAGRYRIVAVLGHGGMGEVVRAVDTRLREDVALKFLPEAIAGDPIAVERLLEEVRVGRSVSHPSVCRLHDLVEADGARFIAMEYVDGEDLATLLRRIGRISPDKAMLLAHDLCDGLAAAHDAGVIHRDLKPGNVMIDGRGRARITDFGLAIPRADVRSGEFAGTPAYMAPEQLEGGRATFASDLYALGLVIYEMVAGRRLFDGTSLDELRAQHRSRSEPLDVPEGLDRLFQTVLAEAPELRPRSAREVASMLPGSETVPAPPKRPPLSTPRDGARASIAVLPFEDLGSGDDAFSAGLADEIISDLAKIRAIRVISRGSAMRYRGTTDLVGAGRELGVGYVLTGSVRRIADELRLNANLVDTGTDVIVWSEKFRGSMSAIFDIQESVARTVAEQLRVHVSEEESARIAERPITDPTAYEYYVRARSETWKFTADALQRAGELLRAAEALAGENVAILEAIAYIEWQYFNSKIDPDERHLIRAAELAARIEALSPGATGVHRLRALLAVTAGDARGAIASFRDVLAIDPTDSDSAELLTLMLAIAGRTDLARPIAESLRQRDPFSMMSIVSRAFLEWFSGNLDEVIRLADMTLRLHGANVQTEFLRACTLLERGSPDALAAFAATGAGDSGSVFIRISALIEQALRGDRERALAIYRESVTSARSSIAHGTFVGLGLAAVGESELALDWLRNAADRGFGAADLLERFPLSASLRDRPEFRELMARMRRLAALLR